MTAIISMALLAVFAVTMLMLFFEDSTPDSKEITAKFDEVMEKEFAKKKFHNAKKNAEDAEYK